MIAIIKNVKSNSGVARLLKVGEGAKTPTPKASAEPKASSGEMPKA